MTDITRNQADRESFEMDFVAMDQYGIDDLGARDRLAIDMGDYFLFVKVGPVIREFGRVIASAVDEGGEAVLIIFSGDSVTVMRGTMAFPMTLDSIRIDPGEFV